MTREEADFIGSMNMCDEISNEAYKKIMCHCEEREPCTDAISRKAAIDAAWNLNLETSYDNEKAEEMLKDLPSVQPKPKKQATSEIDNFVSFLIRENCEGCKECEPRLSADWKPKFACVEEGRAKWLLSMAEKYKAESAGKNDN